LGKVIANFFLHASKESCAKYAIALSEWRVLIFKQFGEPHICQVDGSNGFIVVVYLH